MVTAFGSFKFKKRCQFFIAAASECISDTLCGRTLRRWSMRDRAFESHPLRVLTRIPRDAGIIPILPLRNWSGTALISAQMTSVNVHGIRQRKW